MPDLRGLLTDALPRDVLIAVSETKGGDGGLLSVEVASLGPAIAQRRNAFATGRALARQLLGEMGYAQASIPRRHDGAPLWPSGVCGSFSYKDEWCAVAVAARPTYAALGIDIERMDPIPEDSWEDIASSSELQRLSTQQPQDLPRLVTLAFSAKEAFFKAQCHITGNAALEFREVELELNPAGRFSVVPGLPGHRCMGRVRSDGCWCAAGVVLSLE